MQKKYACILSQPIIKHLLYGSAHLMRFAKIIHITRNTRAVPWPWGVILLTTCPSFTTNSFCIYTDGSKSDDGVGFFAVSLRGSKRMKLMAESSIYTAELCGLQLVNQVRRDSFVIISDSRSALQVVEHCYSTHPLIHKMVHWRHRLRDYYFSSIFFRNNIR